MPLPEMLKRLVHISDGSMVALRGSPNTVMKFADFKQHTRASENELGKESGSTADLWQADPKRTNGAHDDVSSPGAPEFSTDPNGTLALNLWTSRRLRMAKHRQSC